MVKIGIKKTEIKDTFNNSAELADYFHLLQTERSKYRKGVLFQKQQLGAMPKSVREKILNRTGRRCHICGGLIEPGHKWRADYVIVAGKNRSPAQCCLPAHNTSNNSRYFYSPEELKWIFKLGIWFRGKIEKKDTQALKLANKFVKYEERRKERVGTSSRSECEI